MTIGLEAWIAVFMATVVLVLKPGPQELSIAGLAMQGRWEKIMAFFCGSWTAGTLIYLVLLTSLSMIEQFDLGFVFFLLRSLGATWFIYLGIKWLMSNPVNEDDIEARREKMTASTVAENFLAGFILTCSNPFDVLFVTGVIPSLVGQNTFTVADILTIRSAVIAGDFITTTIVCILPVILLKRYIDASMSRLLGIVSGFLMIGIGLYIGYNAIMADDLMKSGIMG